MIMMMIMTVTVALMLALSCNIYLFPAHSSKVCKLGMSPRAQSIRLNCSQGLSVERLFASYDMLQAHFAQQWDVC